MMLIAHQKLRSLARRVFRSSGSSTEEALAVADHLIEANLRGHDSHGVVMIPHYLRHLANGTLRPNRRGRVIGGKDAFIVYDGERGYGQVVAHEVTALGIECAGKSGVAVIALRNTHHIGRVGAYGEQCAAAGLVALLFVNVTGHRPYVAPHRGRDARLSTNPVCIAVPGPAADRPIILDMATSKVAVGKVRVASNQGRHLAPGLLIDGDGHATTDPQALFQEPIGALLPFAEHKGYALSFLCELLAGVLAGGGTLRPANQKAETITNAMLGFIIDPARLVDQDRFRTEIEAIADYVTASPPIDAAEPVLVPGDPERLRRAERIAQGVPIDEATWDQIADAIRGLGLDPSELLD
jgi:hydroxycarboxylate dehydrogenase B